MFYLKTGKIAENIVRVSSENYEEFVDKLLYLFNDGGNLCMGQSLVRLSECVVVDWEVLNEQEAEKGE